MSAAKRVRPAPKPTKPRPPRSPESIAHAAVAHEGKAEPGDKVKLTLGVTLSRAHRADYVNPPTWLNECVRPRVKRVPD